MVEVGGDDEKKKVTIGSLFSGIGGLELGLEWAGLGPVLWQVECDDFCRWILAKHWPTAERFTDVRHVGSGALAPVDLICGGFPCQDVSAAGKGAGLGGARSGLWYEFARIVGELRPAFVVVENVASGAARWVDAVCGELERLGYETLPVPIAARDVGAPHRRGRVFIVAHAVGMQLRDQPRRGGGACWAREAEPAADGSQGVVADTDGEGELQQGGAIAEKRGRVEHSGKQMADPQSQRCGPRRLSGRAGPSQPVPTIDGWWSTEPNVGRVADGVPARVDRLRALGNAVVPQCAQVVGEVIQLLRGR